MNSLCDYSPAREYHDSFEILYQVMRKLETETDKDFYYALTQDVSSYWYGCTYTFLEVDESLYNKEEFEDNRFLFKVFIYFMSLRESRKAQAYYA